MKELNKKNPYGKFKIAEINEVAQMFKCSCKLQTHKQTYRERNPYGNN